MKKGTSQKTKILHIVNELSYLLQMNYLSFQNDSGNTLWMVEIILL
jgi:hypothetical protein